MPLAQELDDATLQGVSDEVDPDVVIERPKSPRELAMEAMGAARLASLEEELGTKLGNDDDDDGDDEGDESEVQLNAQLAADDVITEVEGRKVRVKVDGVERDIDLADAIKQYQKGSAADKRLEEATRLLREAEERARQAAPAPVHQPVKPESVTAPDEGKTNFEALKEKFDKLYLGDSDEIAAVLGKLIEKVEGGSQPTQAPQINIDAIAEQLQQRLAVDTALATVRTDYPDIIANKDIELLTAIKVDQMVAAGAPRAAAILDAAKEVYTALGKAPQGRPSNTQRESKQEKLARKASLDTLPTANVADANDDQPSYPTTHSSLIQEMAARRIGQGLERLQR